MINKTSVSLGLAVALVCTTAFANINANNGFYIGGTAVMDSYQEVDGSAFTHGSEQNSHAITIYFQSAGYLRPFMGYRFNDFFAIEGGYNNIENNSWAGTSVYGPDHYRLYAYDVEGKFIKPFASGFSLYGKVGAAYTHQDVYNQIYRQSDATVDTVSSELQPLLGVGLSYNFNKKIAVDVSYTQLFKQGEIGDVNMLGLGLSYTFGGEE